MQAVAQVEVRHVVQARLVEYRAAHAQQRQGQSGGRVERHDHRRDRSRRKIVQVRDGQRRHLRHRRIGIDVRAKIVAHDADSRHRSRLLPGDAVGLAGPTLQSAGNIAFHGFRGHAWVQRQNLHRRRPESGQNVGWNAAQGDGTQKDYREGADDDQIWVLERSSYQDSFS